MHFVPKREVRAVRAASMLTQVPQDFVDFLRIEVSMVFGIDQHAGRFVTMALAFYGFQGELAVRSFPARLKTQLFLQMIEDGFSSSETAAQVRTHLDMIGAARLAREQSIKGHHFPDL